MTFPIVTANGPSGYNLTRSLRVKQSASAYLSRTSVASPTNNKIFTIVLLVKRGLINDSVFENIFGGSTSQQDTLGFGSGTNNAGDSIQLRDANVGSYNLLTTQVFRDPAAWYQIIVSVDTTQATASNRIKLYANGSQITAFSTATYPSQNYVFEWNSANTPSVIGRRSSSNSSWYFDGYLADFYFIDGQALTPSSFGSTNTLTGVWQPARYTGTYGTNGFYLPFTDNSALTTSSNVGLGKDFSGNGNYWTTNNISITAGVTYDSMTDVPTLTSATVSNFAVANPLQKGSYATVSNGNLTVTGNTATDSGLSLATIGKLTSGKWYWEYTQGTVQSETCGVMTQNVDGLALNNGESTTVSYGVGARANGDVYGAEKTTSTITSWTTGDVIGLALDCDNGAIYWSKNGTWLNSGVPTSGASKTGAVGVWTPSSTKIITPSFGGYNSGFVSITFGQRPFAYTPPTGFVALNTYNLPTSTVLQGSQYMNAGLYTGTGSATALPVTGPANPDFVWIKSRSAATSHSLLDSLRSTATPYSLRLYSNATNAEYNYGSSLLTTTSTGFNLTTTDADHNTNGATYVAWQWQAGQKTNVANTSGTITSTVSVNASAGFSVVTFTAPSSGTYTTGHGLGVAPSLVISKERNAAGIWSVYHVSTGDGRLQLQSTAAVTTGVWTTAPTSSTIWFPSSYADSNQRVAYCWTPIAGYSAFGSYTGNGSTDGPFMYVGFRPRFILYKRTDTGGSNWYILDTARSPYNVSQTELVPNSAIAEFTSSNASIDVNSNGFKVRTTDTDRNASGGTYIYAAFAENPFKNALAR